ncbi:hypothetical protein MKEN_00451500 [Mycena kentingensis (nom. inval.)]|nr:hypothetical protein MKEN_00451500 [Mycena kentingensis (nom. inval.)]
MFSRLPETVEDLSGRTYLVTGGNSGLGFATLAHLARMQPARIILAVRSLEKGEQARQEVIAQTGYGGTFEVWELDMARFASVRAFAERADAELDRLDGAVLNAGINTWTWRLTGDGLEEWQVNLVATGLLAVLLLPILKKTASLPALSTAPDLVPHLTITGSASQFTAPLAFPEREKEHKDLLKVLSKDVPGTSGQDRYSNSKLLLVLLTRELAALDVAKDVIVNVVDPGLCTTNIGRELPLHPLAIKLYNAIAWAPEKGALNLTYSVLKPTPPAAYVTSCEVRNSVAWSYTKEAERVQKQLVSEMVEIWKGVSPKVEALVDC